MKKEKPKLEEYSYCEVCKKPIKGKGTICSPKCGSLWISMYLP